jgi:hypothetical protein
VEIAAYKKALAVLHLLVKKKAMVASFDDCFLVALSVLRCKDHCQTLPPVF